MAFEAGVIYFLECPRRDRLPASVFEGLSGPFDIVRSQKNRD